LFLEMVWLAGGTLKRCTTRRGLFLASRFSFVDFLSFQDGKGTFHPQPFIQPFL
jgi:hypothetical protein